MDGLASQWDALVGDEPDDWSHAALTLRLHDPERMEEAALLICSVNPWHGPTWRGGSLRFRAAREHGYGASPQLVRAVLGRLDAAEIAGSLTIDASYDAVASVQTQGPTF